jgi:NDP-sugar pyrophosphorylase family protein
MTVGDLKLLVLAGGFGTRLQSALPDTPKALAPVGDGPFLGLQLEHWIAQGVRSFVLLLHHQAGQIVDFLRGAGGGLLKDCEVRHVIEPTPLDTGGAVAYAVRQLGLDGDILIANADSWFGSGIRELGASRAPAMVVTHLDNCARYGQVHFDDGRRVTAFIEKNGLAEPGWINAGLYRLSVGMFTNWDGGRLSLERQLFPDLVRQGALQAVPIRADFIDIGIPEDYRRFCRWAGDGKVSRLCS